MPAEPALNPNSKNVQTFAHSVGSSRSSNFLVQFYSPHRPRIQLHNEGLSLFVTSMLLYSKLCTKVYIEITLYLLYWFRHMLVHCLSVQLHYTVVSSGSRGEGAMAPPGPVKIGHKKDGRRRRPHRFHVS